MDLENNAADMGENPQEQAFSRAAVMLLKGIVSRGRDEALWQDITSRQTELRDYFRRIGLTLIIDELDEYAYLRQEEGSGLPHIVPRYPLSYNLSMLLVQLRKVLAEYDRAAGGDRVVISFEDILRRMEPFLPIQINEMKYRQSVEHLVRAAVRMGFLLKIKGQDTDYEVRPILRNFVDAQWLDDFAQKLEAYEKYGQARHDETVEGEREEGEMMDELIRDDD